MLGRWKADGKAAGVGARVVVRHPLPDTLDVVEPGLDDPLTRWRRL